MSLLEPALFAYVALFIAIAMVTDARELRIPNWTVLAIALAYAFRALLMPESVDLAPDLAVGAGILATGLVFHEVFKWRFPFAPGDWKLLAALGLWFGPSDALMLGILTGILGGVLAFGLLIGRVQPHVQWLLHRMMPALARPETAENVMPYGVAIGAASLGLIWSQLLTFGVI